MSEYQYYEFRALDRTLTAKEQEALRAISSRAEISARHFQNVYNYGGLRGDPQKMLEMYFDAYIYDSNWGSRILGLRLPRAVFDPERARPYCQGEALSMRVVGDFVILEWRSEQEDGEWEDGSGWMAQLQPLRDDLARGDLRALYLGWLRGVEEAEVMGDLDPDTLEPPPPPGLSEPLPALSALAEFLRLDPHLVAAAAEGAPSPPAEPTWEALAEGDDALLARRFRQRLFPLAAPVAAARSAEALLEQARVTAEAAARAEAQRRAAEQARKEKAAA